MSDFTGAAAKNSAVLRETLRKQIDATKTRGVNSVVPREHRNR